MKILVLEITRSVEHDGKYYKRMMVDSALGKAISWKEFLPETKRYYVIKDSDKIAQLEGHYNQIKGA